MKLHEILSETYRSENTWLLQYLKDAKFDPYSQWNAVRVFFDKHPDYLEEVSEVVGKEITDADQIDEEEPEIFYELPEWLQKECAEWVTEWLMRHDPADAPTSAHLSLSNQRLLPRTTWLIHFTDDPNGIAEHGFTIGMQDMDKLGLTTYYRKDSFEKSMGGYNFAFLANSRHAKWAASKHKYGRHAVMFQNSGVRTFHYADEEDQIIFWGKDVDPRGIVVLHHNDDWSVESRRRLRNGGYTLFTGDFEKAEMWVIQHYAQYRRYLTGY